MKTIPFGENAVLVKFEQQISIEVSQRVIRLAKALERQSEITFVIPAYASVLAGFDSFKTSLEKILELIDDTSQMGDDDAIVDVRTWQIPVCYDPEFALDLADVMSETGLTMEKIVSKHCQSEYQVFMLGFLPGFPYLGKLSEDLYCKRKLQPRLKVPRGSVGIAGRQTGIYPSEVPGGWQIIGRTPIPLFRPLQEDPFLLKPGDRIVFSAISQQEYRKMEKQIAKDLFDWKALTQ